MAVFWDVDMKPDDGESKYLLNTVNFYTRRNSLD
jgi:hypothetical protein